MSCNALNLFLDWKIIFIKVDLEELEWKGKLLRDSQATLIIEFCIIHLVYLGMWMVLIQIKRRLGIPLPNLPRSLHLGSIMLELGDAGHDVEGFVTIIVVIKESGGEVKDGGFLSMQYWR